MESYQNGYSKKSFGLKQDQLDEPNKEIEKNLTLSRRYYELIGIIFTLTCIFLLVLSKPSQKTSHIFKSSMITSYSIDITSYSNDYDEIKSINVLPWDVVLEPYKEQYLQIKQFSIGNNVIDNIDENYEVVWNINDNTYYGSLLTLEMKELGVFSCSVSIVPKESTSPFLRNKISFITNKAALIKGDYEDVFPEVGSTYDLSFTMAVKYIRREIRSLTEEDRNKFFNALHTTYTLNDVDGQALYGEKYHSAEYFLYLHLNGAGTSDCDHWHDGAGILPHHVAITLLCEQSLQSIDPSLTIPYWEYGQDRYLYDHWYNSVVFNKDWFGENSPSNSVHKISDGSIWQDIKTPSGEPYKEWDMSSTGTLNPFVNAYGMLRSPWNNNPSWYISRHNKTYSTDSFDGFPECKSLKMCFDSKDMGTFSACFNGDTHGPVHILIGGSWNEGSTFDDPDISFLKSYNRLLLFKVLWRMGYSRCPTSCDIEEPDQCSCYIPDEYINTYGAKAILTAANALYPHGLSDYFEKFTSEEQYVKALKALADPGQVGEMFSSGASYDPTFWPIHGSSERLYDLKRILISQGSIKNFDDTFGFPDYDVTSGEIYLSGRCDWSNVKSADDLTLPTCSTDPNECVGHGKDDLLEFSNFLNEGETYTNSQFLSFIHPWNDDLPYTYDTFDYEYCEELGFNLYSSLTNVFDYDRK